MPLITIDPIKHSFTILKFKESIDDEAVEKFLFNTLETDHEGTKAPQSTNEIQTAF